MLIFGSIFLLIIGLLMLCFPTMTYNLTESWKSYTSGEPSNLYKWHIRIGGIVFTLVGIAGIITFVVL